MWPKCFFSVVKVASCFKTPNHPYGTCILFLVDRFSQYVVPLSDQLSGLQAIKNILPQCVYPILTQILRDKDRNGKDHNQFSDRIKRGILKSDFGTE